MRVILWFVAALALCAIGPTADAGFAIYQVSNSSVLSGGFLLDNSAGFVTTPYPGKLVAR